jgi:hypothetical protein
MLLFAGLRMKLVCYGQLIQSLMFGSSPTITPHPLQSLPLHLRCLSTSSQSLQAPCNKHLTVYQCSELIFTTIQFPKCMIDLKSMAFI